MSEDRPLLLDRIRRIRLRPFKPLGPRKPFEPPKTIPIENNVSIPELKKYPLAKDLHHHADTPCPDLPWAVPPARPIVSRAMA
jgi:hypothetical protein